MANFNLNEYSVLLLRIYIGKEKETARLVEDLEYYFLEEKQKEKHLYLVNNSKNDIFIIYKNSSTSWNTEKLHLIIGNCLKETRFIVINTNGYYGIMPSDFWDDINKCVDFFSAPKKFRKNYKKNQLDKELSLEEKPSLTIDEILNKINEDGIDSLTEKEKQILNNYDSK